MTRYCNWRRYWEWRIVCTRGIYYGLSHGLMIESVRLRHRLRRAGGLT